jgi:Zn-dependent peptidase ImmA (M78 family)
VIVLNPTAPGDRQAWNLAHETAHLVLHYPLTARQDDIEKEADRFAAELLMPKDAMLSEIAIPVTLSTLAELKSRWRVAMSALLRRAKELDVVTERQYKYLLMNMQQRGWRQHEPVEIPADRPRGLRKMAEVTYGENFNVRRIAKDAKRPTFLVARLIDVSAHDTGSGEVLGFRAEGSTDNEASA